MTTNEAITHTRALLCRLAACEIDQETHSAVALRQHLRDAGLSDAAIDAAVARVRRSVEVSDG
jgi:hypothetical protein